MLRQWQHEVNKGYLKNVITHNTIERSHLLQVLPDLYEAYQDLPMDADWILNGAVAIRHSTVFVLNTQRIIFTFVKNSRFFVLENNLPGTELIKPASLCRI